MPEHTRFDLADHIATVTFDRDEKRNAFNHAMAEEVIAGIETAERRGARVLVLRANPGARVWCAGHDLGDLRADSDPTRSGDPMLRLFDRVLDSPLPVLTLVEGAVYAGGLILNVVADLAVATPDTTVTMTANRLGIPFTPEMYAYWMRVLGLHRVKELFLTAAPMPAVEAKAAGIFNRVVSREELEATIRAWIEPMLACAPEALADTKAQLNRLARTHGLTPEDEATIEEGRQRLLTGFGERLAAFRRRD